MRIGILALQGDFQEHATCFTKLDVSVTEIRSAADLKIIDGLVIPGAKQNANLRRSIMERYLLQSTTEGMIWPL